ncbi:MAG: hypothetical protein J6K58_07025 [Lachnospiraceae bacterium]|nr:hypothetical protein [Lachnospiraceae bacterium]MBP3458945.1 hypothetical protein [Lachnospiraceae bacterium]
MEEERWKEDFEAAGMLNGYQIYVSYAKEGPDWEEAMALYQEAKNSVLYQNLAAMGKEEEE